MNDFGESENNYICFEGIQLACWGKKITHQVDLFRGNIFDSELELTQKTGGMGFCPRELVLIVVENVVMNWV